MRVGARPSLLRSTTGRFALLQLLIGSLTAATLLLAFALSADRLLQSELREQVADDIRAVAAAHSNGGVDRAAQALAAFAGDPRIIARLESREGGRLAGSLTVWPPTVVPDGSTRPVTLYREGRAEPATFAVRAVALPDGSRLLVGRELDERRALAGSFLRTLALALGLMLFAGVAVGLAHARHVFGRLETMKRVLDDAAAGDWAARLPVGPALDEFDRLDADINRLLEAQSAHIADMRLITDSLAHDIRGPLTRIRQAAEAAATSMGPNGEGWPALARIEQEAAQLLAVTTALLDTTRARSGAARDQFVAVDVSQMVADLAELFEPAAADAGRSLAADVEPGLWLNGHPQLLPQALSNLLENALRHGSGPITIAAARSADGLRLSVSDEGPGIAEADRPRAMEPFVRLDPSRSGPGSGVGLALVSAVATLHAGSLVLADNAPGLIATLELPAAGRRPGQAAQDD